MSHTVVLSLDLDSPLTDFDLKWEEYSYRIKVVLNDKLIYRSPHLPLGKNGHVEYSMSYKSEESAMQSIHFCDFYVDVYWKKKRVATEIRLREPQEYSFYQIVTPDYDLRDGHREPEFKADKGKFDKLTKIKAIVQLPVTVGNNDKKPEHTVEQKIDLGKPAGTLIERAKAGKRFQNIPSDYWILGERATTNRPNQFDDVIHLMRGEKLIMSVNGTTHPGAPALLMQPKAQVPTAGAPIWDYGWHYSVWAPGIHRKKISAFVQVGSARVLRDNNKDNIPGNSGLPQNETGRGLNFHPASYKPTGTSNTIGTWSTGCIVVQRAREYYIIYNQIVESGQKRLSFCVITGDVNGVSK